MMYIQKLTLLKTCIILFFLGNRIKYLTRRLNRILSKGKLNAPKTVIAASALEKANRHFDCLEHEAVLLLLKLSANQIVRF